MNDKLNKVVQFSEEVGAEFHIHTSCGIGRPCIGIIKGSGFIAYNPLYDECTVEPYTMQSPEDEYGHITQLYCAEFDNVKPPNAYHKFDCLAVLLTESNKSKNYEQAIDELYNWVVELEKIGVELVHYKTSYYFFDPEKEEKHYCFKKK